MKKLTHLFIFMASMALILTSCEDLISKRAYCLETSDTFEYVSNMCFQSSYRDVLESIYVFNLPTNPEADEEDYKYDLRWNDKIKIEFFSCVGGLKGKAVKSILKLSDNLIKVNIGGAAKDPEATSGYIKINPNAFKAYTDRVKDAFVYAYVAVGPSSGLVEKPAFDENGKLISSSPESAQ